MRKAFIFAGLIFIMLFSSCNVTEADDRDSLPSTDSSSFIFVDRLEFPKGTSALEIYNCVALYFPLGEHLINGTFYKTETAILNGKLYSDTLEKEILKMNIYKSRGEITNLFHVDFTTDTGEEIKLYYRWEHKNTNAWHNSITDGLIVIKF